MTDDSRIRTPFEGTGARQWREDGELPAPLVLYRTEVPESWVDYNDQMSESSFQIGRAHV